MWQRVRHQWHLTLPTRLRHATSARTLVLALSLALPLASQAQTAATEPTVVPYTVVGDAIPAPLGGMTGDAARGRALVANRQLGL